MRLPMLLSLSLVLPALAGGDLNPENMAKLQAEQGKASAAVDQKYGNRKASELSADERKAMAKDKAAAERAVLDKNGVDAKAFARSSATMGRQDRAATDAAAKDLQQQDATAKGGDAKKGGDGKGVVVEKGLPSGGEVNEAAEMDKAKGLGKGKK